jgi:shikimate dehydrogenase
MADRYAVMGNPIAHSLSPQIHAQFAQQTQQDLSYEAILAPEDGFAQAVNEFREAGGRGLNVTVPFKQEAWSLASELSERAQRAGAVNTLSLGEAGSIQGDNTDGVGLLRDLTVNHGVSLKDKKILILGAGGAVRGVLVPLLKENPAEIRIANRTRERALELARDFGDLGSVIGCGFDELDSYQPDIVINGTAAGLKGEVPPVPEALFESEPVAYDMMYGKDAPTAFEAWAEACGASLSVDGLGMLVEQAAESFFIWRGVRPDTQPVIESLR